MALNDLIDRKEYALLASKLAPFLPASAGGNGGGAGGMSVHELNGPYHTGQLAQAQAPWATPLSTFNAHTASTGDPHPQYALESRTLTAGNGLTGGGDLSASRTFTVGAGLGITVNVDDVALTTPGTLTVSTSNSSTGNHTHAVTASDSVSSAQTALLKATLGALTLDTITITTKVRTPLIDAVSNLTINPAGDLTLDAGGGDIITDYDDAVRSDNYLAGFPLAGYRIGPTSIAGQTGINAGVGEFDEMRARIFVADETRVDRGQEYITKSYGILAAPFDVPAAGGDTALFYVENSPHVAGRIFSENDWILLRWLDMSSGIVLSSVWGQVTDYTLFTDYQRYTFTLRNRGGLAGTITFAKGSMAVNFGASGQGYILSDAVTSTAPFIQIGRWSGSDPYTPANRSVLTHIGRLDGVGFTGEAGLAATIDNFTNSGAYIKISNASALLNKVPLQMWNGATQTGFWLADGRFALSSGDVTTASNREFYVDTLLDIVRVGKTGSNEPNLYWTTTGLSLRQDTTPVITLANDGTSYFAGVMTIGTSGGIYQGSGTFASPTTGLKLWNDSGTGRIAGYNGGTLQAGFETTGKLTAGAGKVVLDSAGLTFDVNDTLPYMRVVDSTATYPERVRWLNWTTLSGTLTWARWSAMGGGSEVASVMMTATDAGAGAVSLNALGAAGVVVLSATTITLSGATTAEGDVTISKASPKLTLTPTGGVPGVITVSGIDNGSSIGARVVVDRNSNSSTPAAGHLYLVDKGNQGYRIWPDDSGVLRIHTGDPTYANDSAGTVVGAQTSNLASKDLQGDVLPIEDVLASVRAGADAVRRFVYKDRRFGGEFFEGVVVDYAPRYGMDGWRALNEVTVTGDLLRAVAWLIEREVGRM